VRRAATIKALHDFTGSPDGALSYAGLLGVNGTLYGTTSFGGTSSNCSSGCGTVFSITPSGTESVLYSFQGGSDGEGPFAGLTNVNGTLYGTTGSGGSDSGCGSSGCGTVFTVTPSGGEAVLYSFQGGPDGAGPQATMIDVGGTLYGTTSGGGTGVCGGGCGTVYSITPSGKEKVLYSFTGGSDGQSPRARLLNVNGAYYGTTIFGGNDGQGIVFKITVSGTERIVHTFTGHPDGAYPIAGLIDVNGTLYGTTGLGGVGRAGT
jgi:uncharacterized repeat protein (TIGR03803 family)